MNVTDPNPKSLQLVEELLVEHIIQSRTHLRSSKKGNPGNIVQHFPQIIFPPGT